MIFEIDNPSNGGDTTFEILYTIKFYQEQNYCNYMI